MNEPVSEHFVIDVLGSYSRSFISTATMCAVGGRKPALLVLRYIDAAEIAGDDRHRPLVNFPDTSENLEMGAGHPFPGRQAMGDPAVGWIAAIIIGGIAGWLAEQFMKSEMGLLMNIVLGIVGAAVASAILSLVGIHLGGWIGYLIAGFIGACILIAIVRAVRTA